MEFNITVPIPASFIEEAAKNSLTVLHYAKQHMSTFLKVDDLDIFPKTGPLEFTITDKGEPFVQINVDLHGIMRVIGGIEYSSQKEEIKLLLVDEGASFLLFQLKGKKALFYGGLNGTEFKRFQDTQPNEYFNYYRRKYRKLTMHEINELVYPGTTYYYDTPDNVEDPRKKNINGKRSS